MIIKLAWVLIQSLLILFKYLFCRKLHDKSDSFIEVNITDSPLNDKQILSSK